MEARFNLLDNLKCDRCGHRLDHFEYFTRRFLCHSLECTYCDTKAATQSNLQYNEILVAMDLQSKLNSQPYSGQ